MIAVIIALDAIIFFYDKTGGSKGLKPLVSVDIGI